MLNFAVYLIPLFLGIIFLYVKPFKLKTIQGVFFILVGLLIAIDVMLTNGELLQLIVLTALVGLILQFFLIGKFGAKVEVRSYAITLYSIGLLPWFYNWGVSLLIFAGLTILSNIVRNKSK